MGDLVWLINQTSPAAPVRQPPPAPTAKPAPTEVKTFVATVRKNRPPPAP